MIIRDEMLQIPHLCPTELELLVPPVLMILELDTLGLDHSLT